jgi:inosine/xanthosine triphosphate pyrophosphatase family protein
MFGIGHKKRCNFNLNALNLTSVTMAPKQLNFITGNKNKLSAVKAILGDTVDLQSQSLDLAEIQGTSEEISADKCRRAADAVGLST